MKNDEFHILVPIRYGRLSSSRGNTYTMVFSQLCKRKNYGLGVAKVVACKNETNSIGDLIEEAKLLWAAETNNESMNGRFWASWGSVGLLRNPNAEFPDNYFSKWSNTTKIAQDYGNIDHTKSEKSVLSKGGFFNLSWPSRKASDKHLPFDLILATATKPSIENSNGCYPNVRTIADAWRKDNQGNKEYFLENRKNGIRTFQDKKIMNLLG